MTRKNDRAAGHLLALLTIIIWGTTFVATKTLLRDYDALQIMLMRFFLAWVLLLLLTRRIEKPVSLKEKPGYSPFLCQEFLFTIFLKIRP